MTPADLLLLVQLIQVAIASAPKLFDAADKAVKLIEALFAAKLITKEQQDSVRAFVNAQAVAVLTGGPPPHWTVEPDPA